jgi:hypothetical protein
MTKAVIVGCVKNAESYLTDIFKNLQKFIEIYSDLSFIFVENDSTDNTKHMLKNWGRDKNDFTLINLDGLDLYEKNRTLRLEIARNAYLDAINNRPELRDFNHLIIIDLDDKATFPLDIVSITRAITFLDSNVTTAGIFANQINGYYDLWALRHPKLCPFDFWHEVLFKSFELQDELAAFDIIYSNVLHHIPIDSTPLEVSSAFGGLGIYKISDVLKNKNKYLGHSFKFFNQENMNFCKLQTCEHVNFNNGFSINNKKLYIIPYLINSNETPNINPLGHRQILIKQ